METIAYVSCPYIGAAHLRDWWNHKSQWYVYLPSPQQPKHSLDSFNELVDELEAAYDLYVEEAFEKEYDEFLNDEDALIHRPDDDPTDLGDCGGCCECLGDPEVEDRFDTLHEQEEFYRETDAMFI